MEPVKLIQMLAKYYSVAEDVRAQIEIWRKLDHKNIAKLFQIIEDKEEQKIYLSKPYFMKLWSIAVMAILQNGMEKKKNTLLNNSLIRFRF